MPIRGSTPSPLPQPARGPSAPDPAEQVERELLELVFQTAPRALLTGLLFAGLLAYFLRGSLPATFIAAWIATFAAINGTRAVVASAYFRTPAASRSLAVWRRRAMVGHGCAGLAWGILLAATVIRGTLNQQQVAFLVFAILSTFQSVGRANYPPVVRVYLAAAFVPLVVVALGEAERAGILLAFLAIFTFSITRIGAHAHKVTAELIANRQENARLLLTLTARKDELDEANRAKTRFLAVASHDLRQPMQAIALLAESLHERSREAATRATVESIRSSVGTMAALLDAILDISKFEAGTVKPERSHFPVGPVLERLRHAYTEAASRKGLDLRVARSSAVLETDVVLLFRILSNLVSNAVRYTESGRVLVGCRRRPGGVRIEVWDTGPGIPEERRSEIFREFVQLANPQRDRDQGLGLGLAIAERSARLLGHALQVRSWPGRGSVFSLEVGYGEAGKVRAPAPLEAAPLEGCSVLVVEDQAEVRDAMKVLLQGWGCDVHAAGSGEQARDQLARLGAAPDVVIADVRLPGSEDGVAVVDFIRARYPDTGGILVSGDIAPEVLRRAQQSGYALLHKPVRPARLRALMGHLRRARSPAEAKGTAA